MNAPELHRKLLYCGYDEVSDYLMNSPVNRYIYRQLIDLMPKHQISNSIVSIFNEVYYQCVRVQHDHKPGMDIPKRYLEESEKWLGSHDATLLVFCIVWVFFKRKQFLSFQEECFMAQITQVVLGCDYCAMADDLRGYMQTEGIFSPNYFAPKTCPLRDIFIWLDRRSRKFIDKLLNVGYDEENNLWMTVTDNYSHAVIEFLIMLYSNPIDQIELYNIIVESCPPKVRYQNSTFFHQLRSDIDEGEYRPGGKYIDKLYLNDMGMDRPEESSFQTLAVDDIFKDDENDYKFNMALLKAQEEELREEEEGDRAETADAHNPYEEECKTLRKQLDELTKSHELELSKMGAKYESEIAELIKQLKQQPQPAPVDQPQQVEHKPKELSLTVSEMVAHVKERFDERAAYQFCTMFYSLAAKHGSLDEEASMLIDSVIPVIKQRDARNQTFNFNDTVPQVNINSEVKNKHTEK